MDPFLDLIGLLRPRATLWGGIEGRGAWAVSFRKRDDLLFCWLSRGECQLVRPRVPPLRLRANDFVLVRTDAPFVLSSDLSIEPIESEAAVARTKKTTLRVGSGAKSPVTLRGGRFLFDTANETLLTGLLPSLVHIPGNDTSSPRIRALMSMNEAESSHSGPGSEFVVARLMELILVEILRGARLSAQPQHAGLIAGLKDPIVARALSAVHRDVRKDWTVADLARLCGVSRSAFAVRFRTTVGMAPVEYLQHWRMALAKDALRLGTRGIGEIGLSIGFQSPSAFSTAFTRVVGISPRRFAASVRQR